jgi:hypothetical protein
MHVSAHRSSAVEATGAVRLEKVGTEMARSCSDFIADLMSPEAHVSYQDGLPWNSALPLKPPLHASVCDIHRPAEHQRTAADDAVDAMRLTRADGLLRDAAITKGPVKPDAANAMVPALLDNPNRDVWRRRNHDTVKWTGYGADVGVAGGALHLRSVWVDRKHFVPGAFQFGEHRVGRLARLP